MACRLVGANHYLNQCWNIVNWTLGNKFQWKLNEDISISFQENTFENVVCKMAAILSWSRCVTMLCIKYIPSCACAPVSDANAVSLPAFSVIVLNDPPICIIIVIIIAHNTVIILTNIFVFRSSCCSVMQPIHNIYVHISLTGYENCSNCQSCTVIKVALDGTGLTDISTLIAVDFISVRRVYLSEIANSRPTDKLWPLRGSTNDIVGCFLYKKRVK